MVEKGRVENEGPKAPGLITITDFTRWLDLLINGAGAHDRKADSNEKKNYVRWLPLADQTAHGVDLHKYNI